MQEKNSDEFQELRDITERFRRLQKSNQNLASAHADAEVEIDRQANAISSYTKEKTV